MESRLTPQTVRAAARLIDLPLADEEVQQVLERLNDLLSAAARVSNLVDDTSDPDVRYDARWDV